MTRTGENRSTGRETYHSVTVSTLDRTWTDMGTNASCRSDRPATDRGGLAFVPMSVHVRSVVDTVTLWQVSIPVLLFSTVRVIPAMLSTPLHVHVALTRRSKENCARHECVRKNWQIGPHINPCSRCRQSASRPCRFNLRMHWVGITVGSGVSEHRQIFRSSRNRATRPPSVTILNCDAAVPHTGYGRRSVLGRESNFRILKCVTQRSSYHTASVKNSVRAVHTAMCRRWQSERNTFQTNSHSHNV